MGQSKSIIRNITGYVQPRDLVALMGPSGSGKTTLLDVLAGRRPEEEISGRVFVNGVDRATPEGHEIFNSRTGYMLQLADTFSPTLTVRENLCYAAQLRLGGTIGAAEQARRVAMVLRTLGLARIADVKVGTATGGGISGGQKRKVALAVEMLALPALLLLDEPTSGLDSTSSLDVINAIRGWCNTGRSAIVTIHQPRKEIFAAFDKLALLYSGDLSLFCSPNAALQCMLELAQLVHWTVTVANPADVMLDFLTHNSPLELQSEGKSKLGDVLVGLHKEAEARAGFRTQMLQELLQPEADSSDLNVVVLPAMPTTKRLTQASGLVRRVWNIMWTLESRFLQDQTFMQLNVPAITIGCFAVIYATLYFKTSLLYSLAACLFLMAQVSAAFYMTQIVSAFFAAPGACYHLEVAAGVYTPIPRLLQLHLHFTAMILLPVLGVTIVIYLCAFWPSFSVARAAYLVLFIWLDSQVVIAELCVVVALFMCLPSGGDLSSLHLTTKSFHMAHVNFAGLYYTFDQVPEAWRWAFSVSHYYQTFPALCRIALEGWNVPEESCEGSLDCLAFRSGDKFLAILGFTDVDLNRNATSLLMRWIFLLGAAAVVFNKAAYKWTFASVLWSCVHAVTGLIKDALHVSRISRFDSKGGRRVHQIHEHASKQRRKKPKRTAVHAPHVAARQSSLIVTESMDEFEHLPHAKASDPTANLQFDNILEALNMKLPGLQGEEDASVSVEDEESDSWLKPSRSISTKEAIALNPREAFQRAAQPLVDATVENPSADPGALAKALRPQLHDAARRQPPKGCHLDADKFQHVSSQLMAHVHFVSHLKERVAHRHNAGAPAAASILQPKPRAEEETLARTARLPGGFMEGDTVGRGGLEPYARPRSAAAAAAAAAAGPSFPTPEAEQQTPTQQQAPPVHVKIVKI